MPTVKRHGPAQVTSTVYWGFPKIRGIYSRGYIGIMEKKMEITI